MAKTITITVSDAALPIIREAIKLQPIEVIENGNTVRRRFAKLTDGTTAAQYLRKWLIYTLKRMAVAAASHEERDKAIKAAGIDMVKVIVDEDAVEIAKFEAAIATAQAAIDTRKAAIMSETITVDISA